MIGQKFNCWTVIAEHVRARKDGEDMALVECDCGIRAEAAIRIIKSGLNKSCTKCRVRKRLQREHQLNVQQYQGKKYGLWFIVGDCDTEGKRVKGRLFCRCECGFEKFIYFSTIKDKSASICCADCKKAKRHLISKD